MASERRALLIVGKSGIGKTNLLCHYFLKLRQRNEAALFINARDLRDADLRGLIESRLLRRLSRSGTLDDLDRELENRHQRIIILLDAVNEYNQAGEGPLTLLESVLRFVQDDHLFRQIRIIATCRREIWDIYKQDNGPYPLDPAFFFPGDGDAMLLTGFTDADRETLYAEYQRHYHLKPVDFHELSSQVKHLIQQPLMMSVIAETYDNREARDEAASRTISQHLDSFAIFGELTKRKIEDAYLLLGVCRE
jgi:energy-coupling factor transporter ATP-binding protein EcfA2